jgi:hypothetical protein
MVNCPVRVRQESVKIKLVTRLDFRACVGKFSANKAVRIRMSASQEGARLHFGSKLCSTELGKFIPNPASPTASTFYACGPPTSDQPPRLQWFLRPTPRHPPSKWYLLRLGTNLICRGLNQ